jgi:hypothetical protein
LNKKYNDLFHRATSSRRSFIVGGKERIGLKDLLLGFGQAV